MITNQTGLEVIKLQYILRFKIKQPIIALCFESENEINFYNIEARCFDHAWI